MRKSISFDNVDNKRATGIGRALAAITEKSCVTLNISNVLTVYGAQVIFHGLKQSQIEQLSITPSGISAWPDGPGPPVNGNVLQPILEAAVQHIPELVLSFPFHNCNSVGTQLSATLLRLGSGSNNHALQTLNFHFGDMSVFTALQLAIGLRHAKVKCLILGTGCSHNVTSSIYLVVMPTVEKLVLFNHLNNQTAIEIVDALVGNTNLQSFEFSLQTDLSINAAMRLANGISQSCIVNLAMNGSISAEVEDILYEMVARSTTIQQLSLGWGFSGTTGLVQCLPKLDKLEMNFGMATEKLQILMTGLRNAPHLTSLVLRQPCFYEGQNMLTVCAALPHLTSLINLSMTFELAYAEQLFDPLDLTSQHINTTLTEQLMMAVAHHPSLVQLTLNCSSDIGFAGLEMIGAHLPNIQLKGLSLVLFDQCEPSDENENVQQAFQRACWAVVAGVQSNRHLHVLTLDDERYPSKVVEEIDFYLDLNKTGWYLLHETTNSEEIPTGLWCHVLAECGNKAGPLYCHLREQPNLLLAASMCHN